MKHKEHIFKRKDATCTDQESFVELEMTGELPGDLIDTVQPLHKHRRLFVDVSTPHSMAAAISKLVTKLQPLSLHQPLESLKTQTAT